ncbi:MAG: histidinol-phosphatase [Armatimonadota bacterium]|nr:histidinol-phosphatase [Armatimonadota bacterium]MDR5696253.1 histidinol-phosphatase [Armatimonadota bacterium]
MTETADRQDRDPPLRSPAPHTVPRPDYHVHLENYALDRASLLRLIEAAAAAGVTEIGITEHAHNFVQCRTIYPPDNAWIHGRNVPGRRNWDVDAYFRLLDGARREGLPIRAAMEWDYCPGCERELERWIGAYDWDFALVGVHWIRGRSGGWWGFDIPAQRGEWERHAPQQVYAEYFRLLCEAVQTGLFDVLAHPDVVKVFGHRPSGDMRDWHERVAAAASCKGLCAEVNTAGWRKPVGELYPSADLLAALRSAGVPIVISSDAHRIEHVGYAFERAEAIVLQAGYTTRCRFERRRRQEVPLLRPTPGLPPTKTPGPSKRDEPPSD